MLRKIKDFKYFKPSTLSEAISLLAQYEGRAKILAGGTDLLIQMKQKNMTFKYLIDIKNITELDYIDYDEKEGLKFGALITHSSLVNSKIIQEKYDFLAEACLAVGSVQTRNKGTVVGNLCNASPSADTIPSLIASGAILKLISTQGERMIKIEEFFINPFENILKETELVAEIQVPKLPAHSGGSYSWIPKITRVDETLVGVAVLIAVDDLVCKNCVMARIGLGSVAPIPIRAKNTEGFLKGKRIEDSCIINQVAEIAASESLPRSRAEYRREMVKVFIKQALEKAVKKIK